MASSKSLKMRAARPRGEGILAAETMVDLEQQIDASAAALEPADTEARLSWRKNLQNRPLGLAGLLDARGQVDVQNIVPVLPDEAARKKYGEHPTNLRAYVSRQQTPTYEQVVANVDSEIGDYVASGISPERVRDANMPVVTMPNYSPLTGVDFEQPIGPENTIQESYDVYSRSMDSPAHEGFHKLIRDTKGLLSVEDQSRINSQIPFAKDHEWIQMDIEHMFLRGVKYVLAPDALKNDPRFKKAVDRTIANGYNSIVKAARDNAGSKNFIDDPEVRSYFHFKKDSDLVDRPKDKYYELVKDRYENMVDILQPLATTSSGLIGKNKGGYVMTGAETMMGLD